MLPNDVELKIYVIEQLETYFFMEEIKQFPLQQTPLKIAYSDKYAFDLQKILL